MELTGSPVPDPLEGVLKEPPPSDLSDYTWDDSETECRDSDSVKPAGSPPGASQPNLPETGQLDDPIEFGKILSQTGLVPEAELLALRQRLFPDARSETVAKLSTELIRRGTLTPYQAAAVRQGKSRGLVIGNYFVLDKIGSGGMGLVLKARDRRDMRVVALKLLPPSISRDRAAVIRFRREAAAVASLRHPNIVAALDSGETHGLLYLVMELVNGEDLARSVKQNGPMPVDRALKCLTQAAQGLSAAHRHGIVHRDIKPANLLMDRAGTVKILDLGLARVNQGHGVLTAESSVLDLTASGAIVGTVDYMSPEQAFDPRLADARSDIYSLGCTFHYLLTGKAPYGGQSFMERLLGHRERPIPSLRQARSDVPESVDNLFRRMLAKSPEARPQTMTDLLEEIENSRQRIGVTPSKPRASQPLAAVDWRGEDDDSESIYDVVNTAAPPARTVADNSSTVFVRSRGSSDSRLSSLSHRRASQRRRLLGALLLFAAVATAWYFGIRYGWLRLR